MPHRIFNVDEVAEYLHVSKDTIERLVHRDEIPFERQGDRIVFRRKDIDGWASTRILGLSEHQLEDYHKGSSAKVHNLSAGHAIVSELIQPDWIQPALTSKTKSSVIRDMVDLADRTALLVYRDDLLNSIIEREKLCSTALGGGIALLHPGTQQPYMAEDSFIVLGRAVHPVPFGSPDGTTTDLFFLLCSQDDRTHLHVLARVCMMCYQTSLLLRLREAADAAEMHRILVEAEQEVIRKL